MADGALPGRFAFWVDMTRCTGCKTCMIACKDKHDLPRAVNWRRVVEYSGGHWRRDGDVFRQQVFAYYLSVACNHCRDPICVAACPTAAMHTVAGGIVAIDPDRCMGCRYCEWSCPYGAPQFDARSGRMTKCDGCLDELQNSGSPACVAACPTRALGFGELDALEREHGPVTAVAPLPAGDLTRPCLVLVPHRHALPAGTTGGRIANAEEL